MGTDIKAALRPAIGMLALLTLLTGLIYPLVILAAAQATAPHQANGSLVRDGERVIGSALIGQNFAGAPYFHPRPSAAGDGYDAGASSGSNLGPTSGDIKTAIAERVSAARGEGAIGMIPAHAVTASGSGLDPHISPAMARMQISRVAAARGMTAADLGEIVDDAVEYPTLGILGEPHVNVLMLNLRLDRASANRQIPAGRANTAP